MSTKRSPHAAETLDIYFDQKGEQIEAQEQSGDRLTGLFAAIESAGWSYSIGPLDSIPSSTRVVVLTTRVSEPYSSDDIQNLIDFVQAGGGLWCMANHAAFDSSELSNNHVRYDSAVASTFFTSFEAAAYQANSSGVAITLSGANLGSGAIITGKDSWPLAPGSTSQTVSSVVTRSFSAIYPSAFAEMVCGLSGLPQVVNQQDQEPITSGVSWCVSIEGGPADQGRVLIGADAGWLGNTTSSSPGIGEYQNGDNQQFSLNALAWLAQLP